MVIKMKKTDVKNFVQVLKDTYPDATCSLDFKTPFQMVVAVMLSAQCTDDVLVQTVENIIEVIQTVEIINCDFADICSIIRDSGYMHTATGIASGEGRVQRVIEQIISSKLLGTKVDGAAGALLCFTILKISIYVHHYIDI